MSLFLMDSERQMIDRGHAQSPLNTFYWALLNRVRTRAASPGLTKLETTTEWWYHAAEYVTDGAMAYALQPFEQLGAWLRDVVLSIVRRPEEDWVGPWFREHDRALPFGHLETAHLCVAVASVLDLAPEVLPDGEYREVAAVLRERGIPLCTRWLDRSRHLNNWRCILTSGLAVSAAVLDDRAAIERATDEFTLCTEAFQPDGSYGESLQYSNYAMYGLMLTYEALVRRDPALADVLSVLPYARSARWAAYSYLYSKPLTGWGSHPMPRSLNFNDSAAIYRPNGDVLLHIAARARDALPIEAGLARWLFDTAYAQMPSQGPYDQATFGFVNQFGFLTLPLLPQTPAPLSPSDLDLPVLAAFSNGDTIARDNWNGRTILGFHGGGDPLYAPSHLHGDLNSIILVHNQERLLLDPGHSCYRNLMRELDTASRSHNTCSFSVESVQDDLRQEDLLRGRVLEQDTVGRRFLSDGQLGPAYDRGGRRLLTAREGQVSAFASEVAQLYGSPIECFTRFCFLLGPHVLFVVDQIDSSVPVRTTWNWLLNNRDDALQYRVFPPDRLVARRGDAGIKLFHLGGGTMSGPVYAYVHDAYHPLPNQRGEGKPGTGLLFRWQEAQAATTRTIVHAAAIDDYGSIAGWHLRLSDDSCALEGPGGSPIWRLHVKQAPLAFTLEEEAEGYRYQVVQGTDERWGLTPS